MTVLRLVRRLSVSDAIALELLDRHIDLATRKSLDGHYLDAGIAIAGARTAAGRIHDAFHKADAHKRVSSVESNLRKMESEEP